MYTWVQLMSAVEWVFLMLPGKTVQIRDPQRQGSSQFDWRSENRLESLCYETVPKWKDHPLRSNSIGLIPQSHRTSARLAVGH